MDTGYEKRIANMSPVRLEGVKLIYLIEILLFQCTKVNYSEYTCEGTAVGIQEFEFRCVQEFREGTI